MFGNNTIVGRKFFANRPPRSLKVTSVFYTIQGEGPFARRPAVFVRLTHCNLACSFCDTFFDSGEYYTFEQLEDLMVKALYDFHGLAATQPLPSHIRNKWGKLQTLVVFTGGEPGLQTDTLDEFIKHLRDGQWGGDVQIESNGLIDLPYDGTRLVISPKCAEDKEGNVKGYLTPTANNLDEAFALKFVVTADPDSPYHTVPNWVDNWLETTGSPGRVFISPMNIYNDLPQKAKDLRSKKQDVSLQERSTVDEVISFWEPGLLNMEKNRANHEYAALYALRHGFMLNLQIHLYASLA